MEAKTVRELIDLGAKSCDGLFYTVICNGEILPAASLELLHHVVEKKLDKVIFISPLENFVFTGMTCHLTFHRLVNGNYEKDIEWKLQEAIDLEKNDHCSLMWEEILAEI